MHLLCVFPPPVVFNPAMSEQLPEPPADMSFNITTPLHGRLGAKKTNPVVEHYNQVQRGEISRSNPNNLRYPNVVTPRSNNPPAQRSATPSGLRMTTLQIMQKQITIVMTHFYH